MTDTAVDSSTEQKVTPRLKTRYREEIIPALRSEFEIANIMRVPGLTKIVVNRGVGGAAPAPKLIGGATKALPPTPGKNPPGPGARQSIAQFKLREGMPI